MGGLTGDRFGGRDDNRRRGRRPVRRRRTGAETRLESLEDRRLMADGSVIAANFGDYYWYENQQIPLLSSGTDLIVRFGAGKKETLVNDLTAQGGILAGFGKVTDMGADGILLSRAAIAGISNLDQSLGLIQIANMLKGTDGVVGASPVMLQSTTNELYGVTDELIVRVRPGVNADTYLAGVAGVASWAPLSGTSDQYIVTTNLGIGSETLKLANRLNGEAQVEWAEPNAWMNFRPMSTNDPYLDKEWHLRNTGQTGGTAGADVKAFGAWNAGVTGSGVVIAIIDDGVALSHPDLAANIWRNVNEIPDNGIDDEGNGYVDDYFGWDFGDDDKDPNPGPTENHGTAVAGSAAAVGNNGIGVAGVAYNSQIMAVKIKYGFVPTSIFVQATLYASGFTRSGTRIAAFEGADVVNHSYGGGGYSSSFAAAFAASATQGRNGLGVVNLASSGNDADYPWYVPGTVAYPASYPDVIAVGGSDYNDNWVSYSQYGAVLEIVAPTGIGFENPASNTPNAYILTTDQVGTLGYNPPDSTGFPPQWPTSEVTIDYTSFNGTSAASPVAAGVAALGLAADPSVTFAEMRAALRASAAKVGNIPYDSNGWNQWMGYGRVDANAIVQILGKFRVVSTDPSNGEATTTVPSELVLSFSRNVDMTTVSASDLTVLAPLGLTVTVGAPVLVSGTLNQVSFPLSFELGESQISTGLIQYSLAQNSMRSTDGRPLESYSGNFIVPLADVTLLPEPVVPIMVLGQETTFTQQITLNGPEFTTGVTLMTQLPLGLDFVRASTERGTVFYDGAMHRVYVNAGNFLPSGTLEVSLTLRPVMAGQFLLTSTAASNSLEINSPSNHIVFPVTVVDVPGVLSFTRPAFTVVEETTPHIVEFPVARREGNLGDATVQVTSIDGTAVEGIDYVLLTPQLTFPGGDLSLQYIQVQILTTSQWFASKSFRIELSDATGAALGLPSSTEVTILDSQPAPVGTIVLKSVTPNPVSESGGFVKVEVERIDGTSKALSVSYATANGTAVAGVNYTATSGTLNWAEGEMGTKFFMIPILQDGVYRTDDLDFGITIAPANADTTITGPTTDTIAIVNTTQLSNVGFNPINYQVLEDQGVVTLTLTRTVLTLPGGGSGYVPPIDVAYATANGTAIAGVDYNAAAGVISWAAGDVSPKTITISVIDKPSTELDRNFFVNLSDPSENAVITSAQAQVVIKDTDIDSDGPTVQRVQYSGTAASISQIYLTFSEPLDVASATNTANYFIRDSSGFSPLISGVQYLSASNAVIVSVPAGALRANTFYQLTVNGSSPNGVKDIFGNLLNGTGVNGTSYDTSFARGTSITYVDDMNNRVQVGLRGGGFFDLTRLANGTISTLAITNGTRSSVLSGSVRRIDTSSSGYTRIDTISGVGQPRVVRITMTTPPFYVNQVIGTNTPLPGGASPVIASRMAANRLAPSRVVRRR